MGYPESDSQPKKSIHSLGMANISIPLSSKHQCLTGCCCSHHLLFLSWDFRLPTVGSAMIRCSFFQPMADISGWCFRKFACEWWCRNSTRFGRRTGHAWAKKGSLGASSPNGPTFSRVHQHSLPKFIHVVYPCLSKCQHPGDYLWHRMTSYDYFVGAPGMGFAIPAFPIRKKAPVFVHISPGWLP